MKFLSFTVADATNDRLYVLNTASSQPFLIDKNILVFNNASTANGNVSASRVIAGAATQLEGGLGHLFLDTVNDRLYVPSNRQILIFNNASTINGNVAPDKIISGSNAGFGAVPMSVFVDITR